MWNRKKFSFDVALVVLFLANAGIASAQQTQLTRIGDRLARSGYQEASRSDGRLDDGESIVLAVWLDRGIEYSIRGTCDADCTDLDLELISADGVTVDRDFLSDDLPIVEARPARSGRYLIRVAMATCSLEPCAYAVGIFRR